MEGPGGAIRGTGTASSPDVIQPGRQWLTGLDFTSYAIQVDILEALACTTHDHHSLPRALRVSKGHRGTAWVVMPVHGCRGTRPGW
jgi:hypothetical protein